MNKVKKRIKGHNVKQSGFTLIEVVVCVAILSVVALCVSIMMNAGTNMFVRVNGNITLSNRTQIPLVQMKEYVIDSVGACQVPDGTGNFVTYVAGFDNGELVVYSFMYDEAAKKVLFDEGKLMVPETDPNAFTFGVPSQPFASGITEFTISFIDSKGELINIESASAITPSGIKVEITAEMGSKTYSKSQIITFRNKPIFITEKVGSDPSVTATFVNKVKEVYGS